MRRKVKKFTTCLMAFALTVSMMNHSQLSVLAETADAPAETVSEVPVSSEVIVEAEPVVLNLEEESAEESVVLSTEEEMEAPAVSETVENSDAGIYGDADRSGETTGTVEETGTGEELTEESTASEGTATEEEPTQEDSEEESTEEESAEETTEEETTEVESEEETAEEAAEEAQEFSATVDGVTVRAYAAPGVFPEGVTMSVTALGTEDSDVADALDSSDVEYDGFIALDISFYDGDTEIEPEDGAVQVSFELDAGMLDENADPASLEVQHLAEDEDGNVVDVQTVADAADETAGTVELKADEHVITAEFEVNGFSTFTITYTRRQNTYEKTVHIVVKNANGEYEEIPNVSAADVTLESGTNGTSQAYNIADAAVDVLGYEYLNAELTGGTVIQRIRYSNRTGWQYSTEASGDSWVNLTDDIYMVYQSTGPSVLISKSISGSRVTLNAKTANFTQGSPSLTWEIVEGAEYAVLNSNVLTWNDSAQENAAVTVRVTAANGEETAAAEIILVNEFFTITYKKNGSNSDETVYLTERYRAGEIVTLNNGTGLTRDGYTLVAWGTEHYTTSSETNRVYYLGDKVELTSDLTLYAQWSSGATVCHMDIRVENVNFIQTTIIQDHLGNEIDRTVSYLSGTVTNVKSATVTWEEDGGTTDSHTYNGYSSKNNYEFRLGNLKETVSLSRIKSVTATVTIQPDNGDPSYDAEIHFTEEQWKAAWANCGNQTASQKGMDFNISGNSSINTTEVITAKLVVTKIFDGLTKEQIESLSTFNINVTGNGASMDIDQDYTRGEVTIAGATVNIIAVHEAVEGAENAYKYTWSFVDLPTGNYSVTESGEITDALSAVYQVTSKVDGAIGTDTTANVVENDTAVVNFINTYSKQDVALTVQKVFKGLFENEVRALIEREENPLHFKVEYYQSGSSGNISDYSFDAGLYLKDGGTATLSGNDTDKVWTYSYTISQANVDKNYLVSETDYDVPGYECASEVEVTGATAISKKSGSQADMFELKGATTVSFTNTYTPNGDLTIVKKISGLSKADIEELKETLTFTVKDGEGNEIGNIKLNEMTAGEGQYSYTLEALESGTYSVIENGTTVENYDLTASVKVNDGAVQKVNEDGVTADVSTAVDATVEFTNAYTRKTHELKLQKLVTGDIGDRNEDFTFKLWLTADDESKDAYVDALVFVKNQGAEENLNVKNGAAYYEFTLKHEDTVTIIVPDGYTYEVKETRGNYTLTVSNPASDANTIADGTSGKTVNLTGQIVFSNNLDVVPPTGIDLNTVPYLLMLLTGLTAVVWFVLSRRRRV